ncbi:MFS transporter, MHS family, alpha-ketoglutarate permease [Hymenobacter daecheongensis DSM 21074]|uniref:MFS transporter, MHS family, alpha-ketoglutarate permease n=1 Tax=Hymenobacter daecheongensis DSM 21074 TaxID=1121955 RepID=A0A1M6JXA1_9BACT|nr:MFS transporter [Hymenobacter daecheongensis]SHJ51336.1 MFS transporter, MHS family, alpha-ketoglutarate permease [Hymenobacter daecheongensis DSM 21074]
MLSPSTAPRHSPAARLRSIVSGSIGNLVEWYDWYVYSAFALYFAPSFFPKGNLTAQLLNTAAIFAVGFLMRPLGGWLLGTYADRHGRKAALLLSVLLMCAGSLLIALTPSYESIGVAAPILLVVARLTQGLSVGGEYGTSATYLSEMADAKNRGFYSSFQYVTLIAGQLLALLVQLGLQRVLSPAQLYAWGWRIPFALGAVAAVSALYLRRSMTETEAFAQQTTGLAGPEKPASGQLRTLLRYPREVLTVVGMTLGGTIAFYTFTTYAQKFLVNTAGFSKDAATLISFGALAVTIGLQPVLGAVSDRVGRRPVLLFFGVGATLGTVPLLTLLARTHDAWTAFGLLLLGLIIVSGYTSINAIVKAELFPTHIRALGVGLPYALTVAIFGGSAEYVALQAKAHGVESWYYWYVTACAAISLVVYLRMNDTQQTSRLDDESR